MKAPITFSICIPNFNYGRYIGSTIQSVLDQSYPHFEIIVADNASTDDSVAVVRSFGDTRIKLIQNPYNLGFAPNLDRATETATGDYMILVSSDDTMKPSALECYVRLIQAHNGEHEDLVLSSDVDIIDSDGHITGSKEALGSVLRTTLAKIGSTPVQKTAEAELWHGHDVLRAVLQGGTMTNIGKFVSTCYSRRLFERVGGYHSIMSVIPDAQFSQKLALQNPLFIFVGQPLFQYRIHGQNFYSQIFSNVKMYGDKYLLSQMYSDQDLQPLGLTRTQVQQSFTQHWFLDNPFIYALQGQTRMGFRAWCYGLAAYPEVMARSAKCWIMPFLLLCSPVFGLLYRLYRLVRA